MRKTVIIILLAAICFAAIFFAIWAMERGNNDDCREGRGISSDGMDGSLELNFSADKNVYRSSEEMELKAVIETPIKLDNITVKVYGIRVSGGYRVSDERLVHIDPPGRTETFIFRIPSCYGCAGVSPGEYPIKIEIEKNGTVISNSSTTISLQK